MKTEVKRAWVRRKDDSLITAKLTIQTCISYKKGLVMVTFFNPFEEVSINAGSVFQRASGNISYKHDEVSIILVNDQNVITDLSYNFKQNFLDN
mmetsp:Transcript_42697/g.41014  ORF Transcript_42697/g.41014 Transcript_42697/m.41014 type:complete len:94 (-) Transcript_42697:2510-2791(-)